MNNDKFRDAFVKLASEWQLTDEIFKLLEEFTCRLYVSRTDIVDVNEIRYELFRVKDGNVESSQLPPCQDCLHLHAVRANYQAAIWHSDNGELMIKLGMTGEPAAGRVSCKCKKS